MEDRSARGAAGQTGPTHYFSGRAPIDAYGNGGFRFAEIGHRGSLLILSDRMCAWPVTGAEGVRLEDFALVLAEVGRLELLLFGTGTTQIFPPTSIADAFEAAGIGLEAMATGAACRTYNVLAGEHRAVGAALIAVD
ncbi:MAG: hypothetical protein GC150_05975 [Rhizobiales bacterium]|nr:hypothetical protein [Hyphomicrobiales bacterium]